MVHASHYTTIPTFQGSDDVPPEISIFNLHVLRGHLLASKALFTLFLFHLGVDALMFMLETH